jgi:hypothetical protein
LIFVGLGDGQERRTQFDKLVTLFFDESRMKISRR